MGKAIRLRGECQKNIVKLLDGLCGRYSRWEVWQDFIIMSAISIANVLGGPHREAREREYMEHASRYSSKELEVFAQMLAEVAMEMEREPDQDLLGELFMALGLSNEWKGQFFTPYSVCRAMSGMTYGDDLKARIEQRGWVAVNDPACGAGALLIAFANECRRPGNDINFQTSVLFVAQDIDFLAGMMCYIQLSLMGCPGYVVIDDSISHPITGLTLMGSFLATAQMSGTHPCTSGTFGTGAGCGCRWIAYCSRRLRKARRKRRPRSRQAQMGLPCPRARAAS